MSGVRGILANSVSITAFPAVVADPTTFGVRAYATSSQSIANNTDTVVNFDAERYDPENMHDNVTNNSRLTATKAGKYLVNTLMRFQSNSTGIRTVFFRKNGVTLIGVLRTNTSSSGNWQTDLLAITELAVNDYVEVLVRQDSGASLNLQIDAEAGSEFGMVLVQK